MSTEDSGRQCINYICMMLITGTHLSDTMVYSDLLCDELGLGGFIV